MCFAFTFATAGKQSLCSKDAQHLDTVHKAFNATTEEQEFYPSKTDSIKVLDEEKSEDRKLTLLDLAKWAQERQWKWKGSPDVGTNHDAYFLEAAEAALEAKRRTSEWTQS